MQNEIKYCKKCHELLYQCEMCYGWFHAEQLFDTDEGISCCKDCSVDMSDPDDIAKKLTPDEVEEYKKKWEGGYEA